MSFANQRMVFNDPQACFQDAIDSGRLTTTTAGDYMYMGTSGVTGRHLFKHILTREYLA